MSDSTTGSKEVEDEWTVVRGRKKRQHTKRSSSRNADDGHLSCCRGHGPDLDLSSGKAVAEQKLREKFASSRERVRSSAFFKNLVEQMERLQILETLLANGRRAGHKACESHLSDGTCSYLTSIPSCCALQDLCCIAHPGIEIWGFCGHLMDF